MANGTQVIVDVTEVEKALEGTSKSLKTISKQTMGIIARETVKVIKQGIRATTERRTGELLKAYRYKVKRDGTEANIFPKGESREIYPKVMALSYGTDFLKALGFVQGGKAYAQSDAYQQEVQKMVDKTLDKYWS